MARPRGLGRSESRATPWRGQTAAPFTGPDEITVGTAVRVRRLRATHVGGRAEVTARASAWPLTLAVRVVGAGGPPGAEGVIDRAVVVRRRVLEGGP
ncbi:hypothetical protein [Streptomyces sp. LaBMicrA B280]|uniref:hypothetical protein n=1 Tax=Streptomyces sp. LaBMicrA B280 TaxID=3391001 RepID=UPI003BA7EC7F